MGLPCDAEKRIARSFTSLRKREIKGIDRAPLKVLTLRVDRNASQNMNPLLRILEICTALVALTVIAAACLLMGLADRMKSRRGV